MKTKIMNFVPLIFISLSIITGCTNTDTTHKNEIHENIEAQNIAKQIENSNDTNISEVHAPFFTYPYSPGFEIQPAISGTLIMQNGCLLLQNGEELSVPVFPDGVTSWNKEKQVLTANGVEIPLNTTLFTNGPLGQYEFSDSLHFEFVQKGDNKCLQDRTMFILGSQFLDIRDYPHLQ